MQPVDPRVLEGRNPWWKEAWEEALTPAERREVRRAIWQGRRVEDPRLLPFVYGSLAQTRRAFRSWVVLALPLSAAMIGLWFYLACFDGSVSYCTFWSVLAVVWVIVVPIALLIRLRQLRRAERANTWGGPQG
jgi:hypothetical protein